MVAAFARVEFGELSGFRLEFYDVLTARADALFELVDATLCLDGPVKSLVELSLAPEHRRGHGALYDAVGSGRIEFAWLRAALGALSVPRAADGRIVLAGDVSNWLRPMPSIYWPTDATSLSAARQRTSALLERWGLGYLVGDTSVAVSPERLFCHVYGRGRSADQFNPGLRARPVATRRPARVGPGP